jgi:hypothetical protein
MPTAAPPASRKPKTRAKQRETVSQWGLIREWEASIFVLAEARHGVRKRESMRCFRFLGNLTKPIKGISEFLLTVFAEADPSIGRAEIPSIGSIISMKQCLDAVVTLSDAEFQLLASMATAGKAASVHMSFQEPRYGSALIVSCTISTQLPDDE